MDIIKVKGNTYVINTGYIYLPFYKISEEEIIMIDTGLKGEREGINELLEKNNFRVVGIICSHAHRDHAGNNAFLKRKFACSIAMPSYEALACSSAINLKAYYGAQTLADAEGLFGHMFCETDIMILNNQDVVELCGVKFKIVHTPGHCPEHICIITPDDVAYLGDSLTSDDVLEEFKMPYAFVIREDFKSKEKLQSLKCSKYIMAHKGICDDITELVTKNINYYKSTASSIYEMICVPMTMEDIMKAVTIQFNIHVKNIERYALVERLLKSYIEYLTETGMLERTIEDGLLKYTKIS